MSSDLYYHNLGVNRPDKVKNDAIRQLTKYFDYINRAKQIMEASTCKYRFKKDLLIEVEDPELFKAEEVYISRFKQGKIESSWLNKQNKTVNLPRAPEDIVIYGYLKGEEKQFKYTIKRLTYYDIEPIGVKDEDKDDAMDTLFDRDTGLDFPGQRINPKRLKNVRRMRRDEKIVFDDPIPEAISAEQILAKYNTTVLRREREAIQTLMLRPSPHHLPLLNLLQMSKFVDWPNLQSTDFYPITERLQADTEESKEQRDFVKKALGTPDFAVLEGPPGSGKTTSIIELILQLIKDQRVLMVASTHVAVDNILERLAEKDEDGVSLADKHGVIPLRIGYEEDVHPDVQQFCVNNAVKRETARLRDVFEGILKKGLDLNPAQKELYDVLCDPNRDPKKVIEQMVLDCANLICGTTTGVIKSDIIKESRGVGPLFDYMIIDEASKTTFAEFLVPALYAERWIISGDVKQLSPYVDQRPITDNLANMRAMNGEKREYDKEICLQVFQATTGGKGYKGRIVVLPDDSDLFAKYTEQAKGLLQLERKSDRHSLLMQVADRAPETMEESLNTLGASIVLVPDSALEEVAEHLPPTLEANVKMPSVFARRAEYLRKESKHRNEEKTWEQEIAWRLSRQYELRDDKKIRERYDTDLKMLLPYFKVDDWDSDRKREDVVWGEIDKIRRIALPSIIELLKSGFYLDREVEDEYLRIPLYRGLPEDVFGARSTMLKFQHRMHPQISAFPREHVYDNNALLDSSTVESRREWGYREYGNRMVWIDSEAKDKEYNDEEKYNLAEIRNIKEHLKRFMEWAEHNPNPEAEKGRWNVAILTFYRGQENRIVKMLRKLFNKFDSRTFSGNHIRVEVCTVDRFQGHEADVVFLSMVREHYKIGFLDSRNRMNVGLTRARFQLVILGNKKMFSKCKSDFLNELAEKTGDPFRF